ncbi:MAG: isoleucine--tRNA ligase, partial [Alphaproteobacteria bacterium]|nr:isoleucine--tRNA ligase [Alphaproteobacteria bacterium]
MSDTPPSTSQADYKNTVFLPKTDFPLRGELPRREPEILARWQGLNLYARQRDASKDKPKFILHDGPPYANGNIHIGHALNKILKDLVCRTQAMLGKDTPYIPGWDCHGLPIEWKVEENYRNRGKNKDDVPVLLLRKECREFAQHWMRVQAEEFLRLGIGGDWSRPYSTMTPAAEAQIVREIHKFALNGLLYKGAKPVLWSVVEKTALADAEVEYHDVKSPTIYVGFPVVRTAHAALADARVVIWTTTPWTMPGNRAIAWGKFPYVLVQVSEVGEGSSAMVGQKLLMAEALKDSTLAACKITAHTVLETLQGEQLQGTVCAHPWRGMGYDFDVPLLFGEHVTTEAGTGFVHIAPSHGEEDFALGRTHGLEMPDNVTDDGLYQPWVPLFAGLQIYTQAGKPGDANGAVIKTMIEVGALVGKTNITHAYPHSWRSKAPLIFRTTPQWFIALDKTPAGGTKTLRQMALQAIGETRWVPGTGENRIRGMIESRPDWCISRQRAWGVPIALFVSRQTGEMLLDDKVFERIAAAFEADGADAWYNRPAREFLGDAYHHKDYEQVFDIVDVWFESGSTHAFVLNDKANTWPELSWPATMYLEGSDQHRGWFHSSLLESCGTQGRAPYDVVLTHGFTLDEQGRKMSKSLGNTVAPQQVIDQFGADILRLWVCTADYTEDLRIGPEILKQTTDLYRRLRNTLRYLLGALDGMTAAERMPHTAMPEMERWVLHRLSQVDQVVRQSVEAFDFTKMVTEIHNFCSTDLSAFYFDLRKDSLYCDAPMADHRRATRTVMEQVLECLTLWLAPVLCFTAEEAWLHRHAGEHDSVHLHEFPTLPAAWRDDALGERWQKLRAVRSVVTGALEVARTEKKIGASLQAAPVVYVNAEVAALLKGVAMAELCITSSLTLSTDAPPEGAYHQPDVP